MHGVVNGELFEMLSASTREALVRAGRPREFRPGEVVFHQGDPCDSLFLLRRGRVSVHVPTPDGDDVTIGLIAAPDAFGEVGLQNWVVTEKGDRERRLGSRPWRG